MASFTAASTAYATWGQPMIPFFIFYSMFGFQRVGDHDLVVRRPAGQGLPARRDRGPHHAHRRGPAALRRAVADVRDGVPELPRVRPRVRVRGRRARARRHPAHVRRPEPEDCFYYLTLYNENYVQPADARRRRGRHRPRACTCYRAAPAERVAPRADPRERSDGVAGARSAADARRAPRRRAPTCGACPAGSSSATTRSTCERWNRLHPTEPPRTPYVTEQLADADGPDRRGHRLGAGRSPTAIARFVPQPYVVLGTDGYGFSDVRPALRRHFEVDAAHVVVGGARRAWPRRATSRPRRSPRRSSATRSTPTRRIPARPERSSRRATIATCGSTGCRAWWSGSQSSSSSSNSSSKSSSSSRSSSSLLVEVREGAGAFPEQPVVVALLELRAPHGSGVLVLFWARRHLPGSRDDHYAVSARGPPGPSRGRERAGGRTGRGGRGCRRGRPAPAPGDAPRPAERHDRDRRHATRQAERPARLPTSTTAAGCSPTPPRPSAPRREQEVLHRRERARVERRPRRSRGTRGRRPCTHATTSTGTSSKWSASHWRASSSASSPTGAEEPLVDRPALAVDAGELVADVGVADDDELAPPALARRRACSRGRAARARCRRRSGRRSRRRTGACARMTAASGRVEQVAIVGIHRPERYCTARRACARARGSSGTRARR